MSFLRSSKSFVSFLENINENFGGLQIMGYLCSGILPEDRMKTKKNQLNIYYMKHSLLLSLLMFVCLGVFGQSSSVPPQKVTLNSIQSSISILQDSIRNLQMQVNNMREKVDTYQKIASDTTSYMHDDMSDMLTKIAIIMAIFGVAFPLYFNYRNEKYMENLIKDAKDKTEKAEKAYNSLENIKKEVEDSNNKSKALHYFVQASAESNINKAMDYYNRCINLNPIFAEAYNNRGILKHNTGDLEGALVDFTEAINHRRKYAEALNNRGIIYLEKGEMNKAELDFNEAIDNDNADAYLNRGLLNYQKGITKEANNDFDAAIRINQSFAEAYYVRGLWKYENDFNWDDAIRDIIKAKEYKPYVVEAYPNHNLLTGKMKELDKVIKGVDYSKDMTRLIQVPNNKQGSFNIPYFVKAIEREAFSQCTNLNSINIPESVIVIGDLAFCSCTSLTSIFIPNCVTEIGDHAFWGCTRLSLIYLPESEFKIGDYAFEDCTNLKEIHLKQTTPIIFTEYAFGNLDLSKITLYVPKGSGEAYRNSGFYNGFKEIIEE